MDSASDYTLSWSDTAAPDPAPRDGEDAPQAARRWIGVQFECCRVYARVYRVAGAPAYEGRCPRCLRTLRIGIGPDGTPARFFRAT